MFGKSFSKAFDVGASVPDCQEEGQAFGVEADFETGHSNIETA